MKYSILKLDIQVTNSVHFITKLRKCKCELLDFLHRFICATSKQIIQYVCEIKDVCMSIFNTETYADIRTATFQIINKVINFII